MTPIYAPTPRSFGTTYTGKYSDSVPQAASFYSSSNYREDLSFAASWLHQATSEAAYLTDAATHFTNSVNSEGTPWNNFGWDTNHWAAALMLAKSPISTQTYVTRIQVRYLTSNAFTPQPHPVPLGGCIFPKLSFH
jgi:hypothetical protein